MTGMKRRNLRKMTLTSSNYFSPDANRQFWSVSLFKAFDKCEASGLAQVKGEYEREESTALLVGSYVDSYYSNTLDEFIGEHPEIFNSRTGELKADYRRAEQMIDRIDRDPLMKEFLKGDKQVIRTGSLFDVDWKIKMDVFNGERIVDLKTVKDFEPMYKEGFGRVSWIEYWGYDIQGAIYQRIEQISSGRDNPLPFYIAAVTKENVPDIDVIHIPQPVLDTALKVVEAKIDRFDLIKLGEIEPNRCERCEFCKRTKVLTAPSEYMPQEVADE